MADPQYAEITHRLKRLNAGENVQHYDGSLPSVDHGVSNIVRDMVRMQTLEQSGKHAPHETLSEVAQAIDLYGIPKKKEYGMYFDPTGLQRNFGAQLLETAIKRGEMLPAEVSVGAAFELNDQPILQRVGPAISPQYLFGILEGCIDKGMVYPETYKQLALHTINGPHWEQTLTLLERAAVKDGDRVRPWLEHASDMLEAGSPDFRDRYGMVAASLLQLRPKRMSPQSLPGDGNLRTVAGSNTDMRRRQL